MNITKFILCLYGKCTADSLDDTIAVWEEDYGIKPAILNQEKPREYVLKKNIYSVSSGQLVKIYPEPKQSYFVPRKIGKVSPKPCVKRKWCFLRH